MGLDKGLGLIGLNKGFGSEGFISALGLGLIGLNKGFGSEGFIISVLGLGLVAFVELCKAFSSFGPRSIHNTVAMHFIRRIPTRALRRTKLRTHEHMGGCQNYFLGTLNTRCRTILGTQKGTLILTTTHMHSLLEASNLKADNPSTHGWLSKLWSFFGYPKRHLHFDNYPHGKPNRRKRKQPGLESPKSVSLGCIDCGTRMFPGFLWHLRVRTWSSVYWGLPLGL